jgi:hypothetical protein
MNLIRYTVVQNAVLFYIVSDKLFFAMLHAGQKKYFFREIFWELFLMVRVDWFFLRKISRQTLAYSRSQEIASGQTLAYSRF